MISTTCLCSTTLLEGADDDVFCEVFDGIEESNVFPMVLPRRFRQLHQDLRRWRCQRLALRSRLRRNYSAKNATRSAADVFSGCVACGNIVSIFTHCNAASDACAARSHAAGLPRPANRPAEGRVLMATFHLRRVQRAGTVGLAALCNKHSDSASDAPPSRLNGRSKRAVRPIQLAQGPRSNHCFCEVLKHGHRVDKC